jgi:hypothetical protein
MKNPSECTVTKPNVSTRIKQRFETNLVVSNDFSLESIIFGGGNSNKKWRPCLMAFLSILFSEELLSTFKAT